jgi:hypothetical protein
MKVKKLSIVSIIVGLCIASIPAVAQAATPLVLTTGNCPTSLTVNATLKSNVTCNGTININSANITLNLNGYTLGTTDNRVIIVNRSGFTLTGGTIRVNPGYDGVLALYVSTLNISKVNFIAVSEPSETKGININGVARANVSNSKFSDLTYGMYSEYSSVNLSNSTFYSNYRGFESYTNGVVNITGSSFTYNTEGIYAIRTTSLNISSSKADYNTQGMYLDADRYGVVNINSSFARNNLGYGIQVYDSILAGKTSSIINTVASGNGSTGFIVQFPGSMTFKGNLANDNGGDGVYSGNNSGSDGPLTGSYNSANNNGGWGLYVQYPVAGTGNTATGNYYDQCFGFVCKK